MQMKVIISGKDLSNPMQGKLGEIIRFGIVGVIATVLQYAIYYGLIQLIPSTATKASAHVWTTVAMTVGYVLSFIFNFIASTRFTFRVKANARRGAGFLFSHVVNYCLQMLTLNFFLWLGLSKAVAPIPMFCICVPVNFLLVRFFLEAITMKKSSLFLFLLFLSGQLLAQRPSLTSFSLSNGMTVWLNEDHAQPKVFGAVVVKAGAKDCPNSGIAHYLEHLLFKGTQKIGTTDYAKEKPWLDSISAQYDRLARTTDATRRLAIQRHINDLSIRAADYAIPNEFGNLIDRFGGTGLNAYTSFDETVFHNAFSPQYIRQWCELNAERMRDPVFRLFQGELETVYEEKNMYTDNLLASTAEKAQQIALAGTPYAYPIIGATDSLKNPRLTEMMRFFRERYVPANMGLILCGDIRADSLRPLLERTFGTLQASGESFTPTPVARLRDFTHMPLLRLEGACAPREDRR